jgi:hypothetical protein
MVVVQVSTGPHLTDVGCKRTFVVLVDRLEIEVVGSEETWVLIIMRILIDRGSSKQ